MKLYDHCLAGHAYVSSRDTCGNLSPHIGLSIKEKCIHYPSKISSHHKFSISSYFYINIL